MTTTDAGEPTGPPAPAELAEAADGADRQHSVPTQDSEYLTSAYAQVLEHPEQVLIAVDFDGTLSPITTDPEQAYANEDAVAALARIGALVGTVAVITGRPARTAVQLGRFREVAGLESMIVLGQYGVERWDAETDNFDLPPAPPEVAAAAAELPGLLLELGLEQVRLEHKGRAIGVHTRGLPDSRDAYERLVSPLTGLADRFGLTVEPGRQVIELRASQRDKGETLKALVEERQAEIVVFAGDDLGDLPAFEAVEQLREQGLTGLLICSASGEEDALTGRADVVLDGPTGVAAWLTELAGRLEGRRPLT